APPLLAGEGVGGRGFPAASQPATRTKVRIRFRKDGDLRLVSHRDLMKCCERMFRRAEVPVSATRGFNPKPRMLFPLSLALGIAGCEEVLELELDGEPAPEAVHEALARQAPPGLTILSVRRIDLKMSGRVRRVCYRLPLEVSRPADLPERIKSLLTAPECWIERTRPQSRRLNLRPYVRDLRLLPASEVGPRLRVSARSANPQAGPTEVLEIDLWVTPGGTARPDEVLALLGLPSLLETGVVLERTQMELHDEIPSPGPLLPTAERGEETPAEADDDSRPAALIPGPLSFDS
ncbi:MAG TPA: TIGR03936 family radical SAM-associated protein, partial [Gemmataceae bacterium]|nr:TIGR03936 family radical SAM-associated protein [Gemmataceae bacterium]